MALDPLSTYDKVVFHFDGNNNDPDDIAALAMAALLAKAAGIEDKIVFYYGNNLSEKNNTDQLAKMDAAADFSESLGIETVGYQDDIAGATAQLAALFNDPAHDNVLVLDGGPMEASYRALELTDPGRLSAITQVSHSGWNENRDVINRPGITEARTWDDIADDFPAVEQVEIRDQNNGGNNDKGFNNASWSWLDTATDPVLTEAREIMELAPGNKKNDPSDAGMLFFALTGNEDGTPQDAEDYFEASGAFDFGGTPPVEPPKPPAPPEPPEPPVDAELPEGYSVFLVDTQSDAVILELFGGDEVDESLLAGRSVGLAVTTDASEIDSMRLSLGDQEQLERIEPYALFGDINGDYREGQSFEDGAYALEVNAYATANGNGPAAETFVVDFTVTPASDPDPVPDPEPEPEPDPVPDPDLALPEGYSAFIVDTATDDILAELTGGDTIDFADLSGRTVSIAVFTEVDEVDSMRLSLDGASRLERVEPYALFGDIDEDYMGGRTLDAGSYAMSVDVFSTPNGTGTAIESFDVDFDVV